MTIFWPVPTGMVMALRLGGGGQALLKIAEGLIGLEGASREGAGLWRVWAEDWQNARNTLKYVCQPRQGGGSYRLLAPTDPGNASERVGVLFC